MAMPEDPAGRHRAIAARFGDIALGVTDWAAPSPVPGWRARDVVAHLIDWSTGFLDGSGAALPPATTMTSTDPVAAWFEHASAVQGLFDDGDRVVSHPKTGTHSVADMIDMFYTTDIFLHSWDLAMAAGIAPDLDPDHCATLLAGMEPIEALLRSSGHYGPRFDVAPSAPVQDRLMAFIGRDPHWTP